MSHHQHSPPGFHLAARTLADVLAVLSDSSAAMSAARPSVAVNSPDLALRLIDCSNRCDLMIRSLQQTPHGSPSPAAALSHKDS